MEAINQKVIGLRVRSAREARSISQEDVAKALGLNDRQSISDLENGKRSLKPAELLVLSEVFDKPIDFFIDPFAVQGEAQFAWRADPAIPEKVLDDFEVTVGSWIGLLRWLRAHQGRKPSALQMTLRLSSQSSYEDAQEAAEALVTELHLGLIPAAELGTEVEQQLGIPVLYVDTTDGRRGTNISGATCHLNDLGVILVNRHEVEGRRNFDLAHELFHALTWDVMPPPRLENSVGTRFKFKRIEELANQFASALLMPKESLKQLVSREEVRNIDHLLKAAQTLRVTHSAFAWRLFNLKMIDVATREDLAKRPPGSTVVTLPRLFSREFVSMLHQSLDAGQISARKAAKATGLGLSGLRELFTQYELPDVINL